MHLTTVLNISAIILSTNWFTIWQYDWKSQNVNKNLPFCADILPTWFFFKVLKAIAEISLFILCFKHERLVRHLCQRVSGLPVLYVNHHTILFHSCFQSINYHESLQWPRKLIQMSIGTGLNISHDETLCKINIIDIFFSSDFIIITGLAWLIGLHDSNLVTISPYSVLIPDTYWEITVLSRGF